MKPRWTLLLAALSLSLSCAQRYASAPRCVSAQRAARATATALDDSPLIPVAGAPMLGPATAPVTVVVFSDFQCPFCNRGRHVVADLRAAHPEFVRVVWRNLPLPRHPDASAAAEAALEAFAQGGDDLFWRFHDILFGHQDHLARADLERYAALAGLDVERFRRALDEGVHADAVRADMELASRLGADGTPAFFVNGTPIVGAQPIDVFEQLAAQIVDRAHAAEGSRSFYADMVRAPLAAPDRGSGRSGWTEVHALPVPAEAPSLGPAEAPLVMQVFSDYQCPYCGRVEPTIAALRDHFGDRLRVVWRDYPLPGHERAMPAAEAAREVRAQRGDEAFWRYHDTLFEHQRDEEGLSPAALERYAVGLGVDARRLREALADHRHAAGIRADMEAITATGVRFGTPAFFVNGHFMSGARPLAEFTAKMQALLDAAR